MHTDNGCDIMEKRGESLSFGSFDLGLLGLLGLSWLLGDVRDIRQGNE